MDILSGTVTMPPPQAACSCCGFFPAAAAAAALVPVAAFHIRHSLSGCICRSHRDSGSLSLSPPIMMPTVTAARSRAAPPSPSYIPSRSEHRSLGPFNGTTDI